MKEQGATQAAISLDELSHALPLCAWRMQRTVAPAAPAALEAARSHGAPVSSPARLHGEVAAASSSARSHGASVPSPARLHGEVAAAAPAALDAARLHGEERRRLERDLHDGAQQRLVSLSVQLSRLALRLPAGSEEAALLAGAQSELRASLAELRDLAHGLHPSVLTDYGLEAALRATCTRAPLPVRLVFDVPRAVPAPVEVAAYYLVCEALTNVAKYARADCASVFVTVTDGTLVVAIADDGAGGADRAFGPARERLAVLGGTLRLDSPLGGGTTLRAEIPLCVGL